MYINVMFSYLKQLAWKQIIYFWTLWEWETNDLKRARGWCFSYICTHTYACARVRTNTHVYILTHTHTHRESEQESLIGWCNIVVFCLRSPSLSFSSEKPDIPWKQQWKGGRLWGSQACYEMFSSIWLYTQTVLQARASLSESVAYCKRGPSTKLFYGVGKNTFVWGPGAPTGLKPFIRHTCCFAPASSECFLFRKTY